jgi:hypothetical protein
VPATWHYCHSQPNAGTTTCDNSFWGLADV